MKSRNLYLLFFPLLSFSYLIAQPDLIEVSGCDMSANGIYTRAVGEDFNSCPCYEGSNGIIYTYLIKNVWLMSLNVTDCSVLTGNGETNGDTLTYYTGCDVTIEQVHLLCGGGQITCPTWYADLDGDGFSDGTTTNDCIQPNGYKLFYLNFQVLGLMIATMIRTREELPLIPMLPKFVTESIMIAMGKLMMRMPV